MFRVLRSVIPTAAASSSSFVPSNAVFRLASQRNGSSISVILLENIDKRGERGEVVDVKRGFARNFLIPRKLAGKFFLLYTLIKPPFLYYYPILI